MVKINHLAFIMDGNGRWAKQRGLLRTQGHYAGLKAMKNIIQSCYELKIKTISFYAFSTENWNRPKQEVAYLISLLNSEINNPKLLKWLLNNDVRLIWNGFSDGLDPKLIFQIQQLMQKTQNCSTMNLQIMFNYGSQQKIAVTINDMIVKKININMQNITECLDPFQLGPIDLLIRTSGEQRLSNFMLWELSYSELIFNSKYWPDYDKNSLLLDLEEFNNRNRRYGNINEKY